MDKELFSIGDIVKMTGFTYRTIRYYGEIGLVKPKWSTKCKKRYYTKEDRDKFLFIKRIKDVGGFSLGRARDILNHKSYLKETKQPAKNFAPFIIDVINEQLKVARKQTEKYIQLTNLLEGMLSIAEKDCLNCQKEVCEGHCFSQNFVKNYNLSPDKEE